MRPLFSRFIPRLLFLAVFLSLLLGVIAYARGYRYDTHSNLVTSTGIVAVSAFPKAAKVYVNGTLKGVTDLTVTLPPGQYHFDVREEGYTSWSKDLTVKGEVVLTLDVLLYPVNPTLSPLTNIGVVKAIPVEQTGKAILFSDTGDETKDGVYLFDSNKGPLSLLPPLKLLMLKKYLPVGIDLTTAQMFFSPDYKQAILEVNYPDGPPSSSLSYLLSLEDENTNQFDITLSKDTLIEAWNNEKDQNQLKILQTFDPEFVKVASDSFKMIAFSPDESKLLYYVKNLVDLPIVMKPRLIGTDQAPDVRSLSPNNVYVYDRKEDRNYILPIPGADTLIKKNEIDGSIGWYPDSKHVAFKEIPPPPSPRRIFGPSPTPTKSSGEKITMIDFDGTNKETVYSGPFTPSFFAVGSDGSLIIMTNFNPDSNQLSDLYAIGIK